MDKAWWRLSWLAYLSLLMILALVAGLIKYNLDNARAKARDWDRLDQLKYVYKQLQASYLPQVGRLPPHTKDWQLTGCGGICPLEQSDVQPDQVCDWISGQKPDLLICSQQSFITPLPGLHDNPLTSGPDRVKYKRLGPSQAVLEICLEKPNPEARGLDQSLIGWTKSECPSGLIFVWPEPK